jgi:DNA topoisomerase VI subunit B
MLVFKSFLYSGLVLFSGLSSSDTTKYNPETIITAPIHQRKFIGSLKTKAPRIAERMKLEAVEITVGTKVDESVEWRPLTKKRQTIALEISMRVTKKTFW